MTLTPYTIPSFKGLNITNDPEDIDSSTAIDMLNVDLLQRGPKSRDGYGTFTAVPAVSPYEQLYPVYYSNGTKQLMAGAGLQIDAINSSGVVVASGLGAAGGPFSFAKFGTPTNEYVFAANGGDPLRQWNGAVWVGPVYVGTAPTGRFLEVKPNSNRLVNVRTATNKSLVRFSDAGDPLTWDANNELSLTPGDGEEILGISVWNNDLYVFKQSRFFVFGPEGVGPTGLPVFSYRTVEGSGCAALGGVCSSDHGVYYLDRRGIYRTTGGFGELVSRNVDALFLGDIPSTFQSTGMDWSPKPSASHPYFVSMVYHNRRLYFSYPTAGGTKPTKTLVYDPRLDQWFLYDFGGYMASFRAGSGQPELFFSEPTTTNDIRRHSSTYTTDLGEDILSYYQSGFYEPTPGQRTTTRWTKLWGAGSPTLNILTDHALSDPFGRGGTVTLGTALQPAKGYHLKSYTGEMFSHKITSTSAWSLNKLEHDMAFAFQPQ